MATPPSDGLALPSIQPTPRRSLAQAVSDQLLELIASSAEVASELPTERLLSEQLGVSRNVLREALAGLDRLGVVEKRGNKRFGDTARARAQLLAHVPQQGLTLERFMGPIEARRMLEPEIAAASAMISTPATVAEIERWLLLMEDGQRRGERVVEYDSAFHVAIARTTGNPTLVTLVAALTDASREAREASFKPAAAVRTYVGDHRDILEAIRVGDPDRARAAMAAHLGAVAELARATFAGDAAQVPG